MTDTEVPEDPMRDLSYGLTEADLVLDPIVMDQAPDLDLADLLAELVDSEYSRPDPYAPNRTFDMALALYSKLIPDSAFDGLSRLDIFGAALHQAMIWECG